MPEIELNGILYICIRKRSQKYKITIRIRISTGNGILMMCCIYPFTKDDNPYKAFHLGMAVEETSAARARSTFHRYARISQLQMAQPTIVDTGLPRSNLQNEQFFH